MDEGEYVNLDKIKILHEKEIEIQRAYIQVLERRYEAEKEVSSAWYISWQNREQRIIDWEYSHWVQMKENAGLYNKLKDTNEELKFYRHYFGNIEDHELQKLFKDMQKGADKKGKVFLHKTYGKESKKEEKEDGKKKRKK
jgi:hypothetical protein